MASKAIASHSGPPAKSSEAPSPTLFLKNLPEKLSKQDLRMSLYMLFSTYGPVLDVVAMKNGKMRGMAHVVFRDTQASTQAMRALQDFDFFGKPMIFYGKNRSHIFNKLEGVYKPSNAPENSSTELQQSIFNAPAVTGSTVQPPAANLPPPPVPVTEDATSNDEGQQGVKRRRDDESDEEEAPMEEDDDDVSMEASSDDE